MSDNEIKVGKSLLIQELIFAPCGKTVIDVRTRALSARKRIGNVQFYHPVGGRPLQDALFGREVKIFRSEKRGRKTEHIHTHTLTSYDLIAKNLSLILPITGDEVKRLLVPFLEKGVERIFLAPLSGMYGLPPMVEPELCLEKWGFRNVWKALGNRPVNSWEFVNNLLRERNSPYRILTSSLDLSSEKESKLEVEMEKLKRKIAELEKGG